MMERFNIEMKKLLAIIFICIIVVVSLIVWYSLNKKVQFLNYSGIVGLSKTQAVQKDSILMITKEDYQNDKDKYFDPKQIEMPKESIINEKAILYLQTPMPNNTTSYEVKDVSINGNKLIISLITVHKYFLNVPSNSHETYKYAVFVELDKTNLKDNMEIEIKK